MIKPFKPYPSGYGFSRLKRNCMDIKLNGEKKTVPDNCTVLGLLQFLQIQHQRVAVELNESIVKKDRYTVTTLSDGDVLEVVSFMGGGM